MPSPVLVGLPPRPLFIGPGTPALADDPCTCCDDVVPDSDCGICGAANNFYKFSSKLALTIRNITPAGDCNLAGSGCESLNTTYILDYNPSITQGIICQGDQFPSEGCTWELQLDNIICENTQFDGLYTYIRGTKLRRAAVTLSECGTFGSRFNITCVLNFDQKFDSQPDRFFPNEDYDYGSPSQPGGGVTYSAYYNNVSCETLLPQYNIPMTNFFMSGQFNYQFCNNGFPTITTADLVEFRG